MEHVRPSDMRHEMRTDAGLFADYCNDDHSNNLIKFLLMRSHMLLCRWTI